MFVGLKGIHIMDFSMLRKDFCNFFGGLTHDTIANCQKTNDINTTPFWQRSRRIYRNNVVAGFGMLEENNSADTFL